MPILRNKSGAEYQQDDDFFTINNQQCTKTV